MLLRLGVSNPALFDGARQPVVPVASTAGDGV